MLEADAHLQPVTAQKRQWKTTSTTLLPSRCIAMENHNNLGIFTPIPASIASTSRGTFEEIKNCTFRNVGGFWEKFFDPKRWRREQEAMLEGVLTAHDGKKWTAFPKVPDEKLVWDWLRSLEERFLDHAPYRLHTTKTADQLQERKGHMNHFLRSPAVERSDIFFYKHVLVMGEQKKSYHPSRFEVDFPRLTRHVQGVFTDQPTRRFVHAFTLYAFKMELWIFDRSGAYSSGTFDIHDEPDKFARALVGYATMDDDTMGLDTFMERRDGHRYKAIVCRGTTCYKTQDSYVAKFSWTPDKRKLEVEQLKRAEAMGVEGVARVVAHPQIFS
ncbi:hypothetical protein CFO_g5581 [Ceratocystis platani]|uniref:Fungal-type protein kinase domain-containing protein n=1 Tax=Ceratocystis fimbriata f. sp. platani TaxID=88771 RepID=A0A0F8CMW6_CERFI|nr:hypothetical protein CFO_g5581 [Ceratocystis platani]